MTSSSGGIRSSKMLNFNRLRISLSRKGFIAQKNRRSTKPSLKQKEGPDSSERKSWRFRRKFYKMSKERKQRLLLHPEERTSIDRSKSSKRLTVRTLMYLRSKGLRRNLRRN